MQRLDAGCHHDVPGLQAMCDYDGPRIEPECFDIAERHTKFFRIDDPYRRALVKFGQRRGRNRDDPVGCQMDGSIHRGAEAESGRRIGQAYLDPEGTGHRIGLRGDLPHTALRDDRLIVGEPHNDPGIRGCGEQHRSRHIEHGIDPALTRQLDNHLAGLHDLPRFRATGGDGPRRVRGQDGVAHAIGRDADLNLASQEKLHFDLDDWRALKFFFYLTPVGHGGGPHVYVRRTHNRRVARHQWTLVVGHPNEDVLDAYGPENETVVLGGAGHGFAVDPFGFHMGTVVRTAPRLMLEVGFGVSSVLGRRFHGEPVGSSG